MKKIRKKKLHAKYVNIFCSSCSRNPDPLSYCQPDPCRPQVQSFQSLFYLHNLKHLNITIIIVMIIMIRVLCDAGFDGGLQQTFHMEVAMMMMIMVKMVMMVEMVMMMLRMRIVMVREKHFWRYPK